MLIHLQPHGIPDGHKDLEEPKKEESEERTLCPLDHNELARIQSAMQKAAAASVSCMRKTGATGKHTKMPKARLEGCKVQGQVSKAKEEARARVEHRIGQQGGDRQGGRHQSQGSRHEPKTERLATGKTCRQMKGLVLSACAIASLDNTALDMLAEESRQVFRTSCSLPAFFR